MTAHLAPGEPARQPSSADAGTDADRAGAFSRESSAVPWYRRPVTIRLLLVLTFLTCLLGYAEKTPCRDTRNWSNEFQYTHLCYSDVVALYGAEGLEAGKRPYLDAPVEYPVLIGAAMQAAAEVSFLVPEHRTGGQDLAVAVFFDSTALLLTLAAGVVVGCTALCAGSRPRDALLVALAPGLLLHAFTNWDLIAVAFAAGALLAWSRRAPRLAGILLGLGAATKLYPILLLVPLGLLCLRAGRLRSWLRTALWSIGTLLLVDLPVYLTAGYFTTDTSRGPGVLDVLRAGGGLGAALAPHHAGATNALLRFVDLNSARVADWDSIPFALQYVAQAFSPKAFAPVHLLVLALCLGLIIGLAGRLRRSRGPLVLTAAVGLVALAAIGFGLPRLLSYTREVGSLPVGGLNLVTGCMFLVALGGIAALVLCAPRRPRVAQVAFLVVVAFLLTNKVFSPQYVLWVLPLAALARPRWKPFLVWQATEVLVLVLRYYYFSGAATDPASGGAPGVGLGWFVAAVALRDLALAVLAALVVREVLQPELDAVRAADGTDDPAGGVLDGAADRWVLSAGGPRHRPGASRGSEASSGLEASRGLEASKGLEASRGPADVRA
jgi:uncharacterized membrane protein